MYTSHQSVICKHRKSAFHASMCACIDGQLCVICVITAGFIFVVTLKKLYYYEGSTYFTYHCQD